MCRFLEMEVKALEYLNKEVHHKKFGDGMIIRVDKSVNQVIVRFSSGEEKKFLYPTCFKTFLTLLDNGIAKQAESDILMHEQEESKKKSAAHYQAELNYMAKKSRNGTVRPNKPTVVRSFTSSDEFFHVYKAELVREITYLKTNGGKHQKIFDGKIITVKNGRAVYTFQSEEELNLPEGTQITIWRQTENIVGIVEGCEEFTVILSVAKNLGEEVPVVEFSAEPWRLLQSLIDRLEKLEQEPTDLVRQLVCEGLQNIDFSGEKLATGQDTAVKMSISQPITFVWGPPGTGKTQTLTKIALEHICRGNRVLMMSYSNVSVDGAIMRVHKLYEKKNAGIFIRYGYPKMKALLDHEYLTSYNMAIRNHPELLTERRELILERKKTSHASARYVEINKRLSAIRSMLAEEEKQTVYCAKFVATTVSKATVDKTLYEQKFDVVIFDEASMAYIPQIIFSAGLAKKHFICMGDFRQLPPIVQCNSASMLNEDIFQYCGIAKAVDFGNGHKWLCLLDTQYRMHPRIADFAGAVMYQNRLKSAPQMETERKNIVDSEPFPTTSIGWVDLSGMMSSCTKTADGSRVNPLSAFITFSYALQAATTMDVGIITPYHAQSRLLHAMAKDAEASDPSLKPISCATVHQFQGSEKDIIIYDSVDCYRMLYPGTLLTSTLNDYANRLFNVALTRAKGKFIGVSNISYMENKNLSKGLMFGQLMYRMKTSVNSHTGPQILNSDRFVEKQTMYSYNDIDGQLRFLQDLRNAEKEIRIDIPNTPEESPILSEIVDTLKTAKRNRIAVYIRAEYKQNLPAVLKPIAVENPYVTNPISMIDKKTHGLGCHLLKRILSRKESPCKRGIAQSFVLQEPERAYPYMDSWR